MRSYYQAQVTIKRAYGVLALKQQAESTWRVLALEFSAYELGLYKHNLMYLAIDYFKD